MNSVVTLVKLNQPREWSNGDQPFAWDRQTLLDTLWYSSRFAADI